MTPDLETSLRATLRALPHDATADAGAVAERVLTGVQAAGQRRRVGAAGVAAVAVVAAAAAIAVIFASGGSRGAVPAQGDDCSQLRVAAVGAGTVGKTARHLAVNLRNDGDSACVLAAGRGVGIQLLVGRRPLDVVTLVPRSSDDVQVEPGGQVAVRATWSNWCEGYVRAAKVRLFWTARGGADGQKAEAVTDPFQPSPSCADHTEKSKVSLDSLTSSAKLASGGLPPSGPSRTLAKQPDSDLVAAATRWSEAMDSYVACLREHGVAVTQLEQFSLSMSGSKLEEARAACPAPKPSLAAGYDAPEMWAALHPDATHAPTAYPTNADGLTYGGGSAVSAADPEDLPDLVAVESTGGTGYVYAYELEGGPQAWITNPQQALEYMNDPAAHAPRTLTAYKSDGVTVVGTFTTG